MPVDVLRYMSPALALSTPDPEKTVGVVEVPVTPVPAIHAAAGAVSGMVGLSVRSLYEPLVATAARSELDAFPASAVSRSLTLPVVSSSRAASRLVIPTSASATTLFWIALVLESESSESTVGKVTDRVPSSCAESPLPTLTPPSRDAVAARSESVPFANDRPEYVSMSACLAFRSASTCEAV